MSPIDDSNGADRLTVISRQRLVSSVVMTRRTRTAIIVTSAIAALAVVGAALGLIVAETGESAAATPTPNPNAIECANITRAYQSWSTGRLTDMYAYEGAAEPHLQAEIDDQEQLLEAVQGYEGQASKDFALTIATFGSELAVLNAELKIAGATSLDQAAVVADAQKRLRSGYAKWKAATCE